MFFFFFWYRIEEEDDGSIVEFQRDALEEGDVVRKQLLVGEVKLVRNHIVQIWTREKEKQEKEKERENINEKRKETSSFGWTYNCSRKQSLWKEKETISEAEDGEEAEEELSCYREKFRCWDFRRE